MSGSIVNVNDMYTGLVLQVDALTGCKSGDEERREMDDGGLEED
jgi:hypothetical protein